MAGGPTEEDRAVARTGRMVALVIACTMLLWMGLQWVGGRANWDPSYAFLLDLSALAALGWSIVVLARLWARQSGGFLGEQVEDDEIAVAAA